MKSRAEKKDICWMETPKECINSKIEFGAKMRIQMARQTVREQGTDLAPLLPSHEDWIDVTTSRNFVPGCSIHRAKLNLIKEAGSKGPSSSF